MNKKLEWELTEEDGDEVWKAIVFCGEYTVRLSIDNGRTPSKGYVAIVNGVPLSAHTEFQKLREYKLLETVEIAQAQAQEHWDERVDGCETEEETGMKKYTAISYSEETQEKSIDHIWGMNSGEAFAVTTHNRLSGYHNIAIFEGHLNDIYDIEFAAGII